MARSAKSSTNTTVQDPIKQHAQDLYDLKVTDPDFYQYLMESEQNLLNFGKDFSEDDEANAQLEEDMFSGEDDGAPSSSSSSSSSQPKKKKKRAIRQITAAWIDEMDEKLLGSPKVSLRQITKLVVAFRSASMLTESEAGEDRDLFFRFADTEVYEQFLLFCFSHIAAIFDKFLGVTSLYHKTPKKGQAPIRLPDTYDLWPRLRMAAQSFVGTALKLLHHHESNDGLLVAVLRQLKGLTPYVASLSGGHHRRWVTFNLGIWARSGETARILAFLNLLEMAKVAPYPCINDVLRRAYLEYVKCAKFVNPTRVPMLNFMNNCLAELYGLDFTLSYQQAFVFIRQMAMHFRTALMKKTKRSYLSVYNWQFLGSLRAWVNLVCRYPGQEEIAHLIYPLVQLILGTIDLLPSPRFFPMRVHCVALLNDMTRTIPDLFVPVAPYLYEIFEYCAITKPLKQGKGKIAKAPNLVEQLKFSKDQLLSKITLEVLFNAASQGYVEHLYCCAYSPGFPEFVVPAAMRLRKIAKSSQNLVFRKRLKVYADKLTEHGQFITAMRTAQNLVPERVNHLNHMKAALTKKKGAAAPPFESFYQSFTQSQKDSRAAFMQQAAAQPLAAPYPKKTLNQKNNTTAPSKKSLPKKK